MIIGLTGGIGVGKTKVAEMLKNVSSIAIYNADIEAKKQMQFSKKIQFELIRNFGNKAYVDEQVNKKYIASIVFNDKKKLAILNAIVHPEVNKHFQKFIEENKDKLYILYENAILFENGSNRFCDFIITVTAPIEERIKRVMARDKTTREAVLNRIKNQWLEDKKKLQSNYIIENKSLKKVKQQIMAIHKILIKK